MDIKNNERLKEIKFAIYLNKLGSIKNDKVYRRIVRTLGSVASALGAGAYDIFIKLMEMSIDGRLMDATDKELIATCKTYWSLRETARKLGMTTNTLYKRYGDLMARDYVTADYVSKLEPIIKDKRDRLVINTIIMFIEGFPYKVGEYPKDGVLENKDRTLELEFWLIYNRMMQLYASDTFVSSFLYKMCKDFGLDYASISFLRNNIHLINRSYPCFAYNDRYLTQEIVYLYSEKGLSKCQISKYILGKERNYLYLKGLQKLNAIADNPDNRWQYISTLTAWDNLNKKDIKEFIDICHEVIGYGF